MIANCSVWSYPELNSTNCLQSEAFFQTKCTPDSAICCSITRVRILAWSWAAIRFQEIMPTTLTFCCCSWSPVQSNLTRYPSRKWWVTTEECGCRLRVCCQHVATLMPLPKPQICGDAANDTFDENGASSYMFYSARQVSATLITIVSNLFHEHKIDSEHKQLVHWV